MDQDIMKTARERSLEDDSKISEAELHAENDGIKESWQAIQDILRRMAEAKAAAIKKVNDDFAEELNSAQEQYAMLISLGR